MLISSKVTQLAPSKARMQTPGLWTTEPKVLAAMLHSQHLKRRENSVPWVPISVACPRSYKRAPNLTKKQQVLHAQLGSLSQVHRQQQFNDSTPLCQNHEQSVYQGFPKRSPQNFTIQDDSQRIIL